MGPWGGGTCWVPHWESWNRSAAAPPSSTRICGAYQSDQAQEMGAKVVSYGKAGLFWGVFQDLGLPLLSVGVWDGPLRGRDLLGTPWGVRESIRSRPALPYQDLWGLPK